jgi:hypothetical protein
MKQVFWVYEAKIVAPSNGYSDKDPEIRMRSNGDLAWNQVLQAKMGYPERVTVRAARENGSTYIGIGPATNRAEGSLKVSMEGGPKGLRGNIASCSCSNSIKEKVGKQFIKPRRIVNPEYDSALYWVKLD